MFRLTPNAVILVGLLAGAVSGCALFDQQPEQATASRQSPLKKLSPSIDAIQLDVLFVERPIGDPTLGTSLWSHLDQVSTLPAATLSSLERNGFRFGVAPSDPPPALQSVLGMTGEIVPRDDSQSFAQSGHSTTRRSGEELSIDTWSGYPHCEITTLRNETSKSTTYKNARCVFRVKVERAQDGWAKLVMTPEIHYGEMRMRRVVEDQSWTQTASQQVDPLFDQRFEVELNLGEMVVLGAGAGEATSLGHHFFRGGASDSRVQRLLIVRLADMQRVEGIYE